MNVGVCVFSQLAVQLMNYFLLIGMLAGIDAARQHGGTVLPPGGQRLAVECWGSGGKVQQRYCNRTDSHYYRYAVQMASQNHCCSLSAVEILIKYAYFTGLLENEQRDFLYFNETE